MSTFPLSFSAHVINGSGRGRTLGTPTINVDLNDVPTELDEGIYAGWARLGDQWQKSAIHYGPRPVFKDTPSFEVHILGNPPESAPDILEICLIGRLRDVLNFPSTEALMEQIGRDVEESHAMLDRHGPPAS